jgi:hypothetical protein
MGAFYDSPAFGDGSKGEVEIIAGVKIHRASRQPCPVCGHPTGDCGGESGPPKTIFGYNTNSSLDDNLTFYVEEDYVEEHEIAPGVTTKTIIYRAGQHIPLNTAKELGLI